MLRAMMPDLILCSKSLLFVVVSWTSLCISQESGGNFNHPAVLQLVSCSAEIDSPVMQTSLNNAVSKTSMETCVNILKASCDNPLSADSSNSSTIIATIGCGCPVETMSMVRRPCGHAEICLWNCYQQYLLWDSPVNALSVCMTPSNVSIAQATRALLSTFGWKRFWTLTDLTTPVSTYRELLSVNSTPPEDPSVSVGQENMYRVFVLLQVSTSTAITALCDAYSLKVYYPAGYVWIIVGVNTDRLLDELVNVTLFVNNCTPDMVRTVLNYSLTIAPVGIMSEAALQDAVQVAAMSAQLGECGDMYNATIDHVSPEKFRENLLRASFQGATGNVSFKGDGSRTGTIAKVIQYRLNITLKQLERFKVATIERHHSNNFSVFNNNNTAIWPAIQVVDKTHIATFAVFTSLYGAVLIFDIGCLLFNNIFRNRRIIKLTSPALSNVMLFGVAILGTAGIFYNIPIHSNCVLLPTCIVRSIGLIFGHDICFVVILFKLVRIHHIFINSNPSKKVIKDWHFIPVITALVAKNIIEYSITSTLSFVVLADYKADINKQLINEIGVTEVYVNFVCGNPVSEYVLVAVEVASKLAMHTIAIVLAVRTRKVKVDAVNEAKEIHAIVYISTICVTIIGISFFTLDGYPDVYGSVIAVAVYVECFSFTGLIFVLKVVYLWRDPLGKDIFKKLSRPPISSHKEKTCTSRIV